MFERVLLAIKPGFTHTRSVKRTKILAESQHFDLLLYSAVHEDQVSRSQYGTAEVLSNLEKSMLDSEKDRLQEIKSHFDGLCRSVSIQASWQAPAAQGILDAAQAYDADLIVLSDSDSGALGRLFMSHTDWEVIRGARVPVLVSQDPEPKAYTKILAAVDPTHKHDPQGVLDDSILAASNRLSDNKGTKLFLGHIYPESSAMSLRTHMPPFVGSDDWQRFHEAAMEKFAQRHRIDIEHTRVISGSPASELAELAEVLSADLIVMGALSKTFSKDRQLGSVAEKVASKLDCDLLFVPLNRSRYIDAHEPVELEQSKN